MNKLIITPKTKIFDLLEAYPDLEETLISLAPEFKKLKNPILRKTIARITNIGQAATIGSLNTEELVNKLREKVGQDNIDGLNDNGNKYNTLQPEWYKPESICETIDIRDMLHAGEQPVHEVLSAIKKLNHGDILKIIAPFIPAPLIDKSLSLSCKHWLEKKKDSLYYIFFAK